MKTTRMYATTAFVSIVLAGCTQQEEPGANAPSMEGMPIRVTTQVMNPETRQEMETKDLTEFYFRVTDKGGGTSKYDYFEKMVLKDGVWEPEDGTSAEWKAATVQVSAVAQKKSDTEWETWTEDDYDNGKEVSVLANQSAAESAGVKASDLLYMTATEIDPTNTAGNDAIVNGKVKVTMNHAFAKLDVTVTLTGDAAKATDNPITALKVGGTRLKAKFTPAAGTPLDLNGATSGNTAADITPYQSAYTPESTTNSLIAQSTASYECIIVPQTVEADLFKVTATLGGTDYTYTHPSAIDFTANKKYTLALTITGSSKMEIDGGVSVGGWDGGTEDLTPEGGSEMVEPLTLDLTLYKENLSSDDLKNALIAAAAKGQTDWVLTGEITGENEYLYDDNAVRAALKEIGKTAPNKRITIRMPGAANIGSIAFAGCPSLASISLPETTTIRSSTFSGCSNLTDVDLPKVTEIWNEAFQECTSLTSISLPSVQAIKSGPGTNWGAFYNCTSLKKVELPAATTILRNTFSDCTALETLVFGTVITDWGGEVFKNVSTEQIAKIALTLNGAQTDDGNPIFDEQGNAVTNEFKGYTFKSITKYTAPAE